MFGECHAHVIMDGMNYKAAVALHKNGVCQEAVRIHLEAYQKAGITFVRDGGDAWGASRYARSVAAEYGIDYRTPVFAILYFQVIGKWRRPATLWTSDCQGHFSPRYIISLIVQFKEHIVLYQSFKVATQLSKTLFKNFYIFRLLDHVSYNKRG